MMYSMYDNLKQQIPENDLLFIALSFCEAKGRVGMPETYQISKEKLQRLAQEIAKNIQPEELENPEAFKKSLPKLMVDSASKLILDEVYSELQGGDK